ncbi:WXG100-like domain-containing protein [Actinomadura violacea]|uniref:Uncharacterized protein n=1 Tax=Actinomadura violacea TaxID=2819934 RepID=A0ABS3RTY2_9ACTN|nr:ADP-ribosyltransferase [Actinomadura violacea]MBO2460220.1 hypothetical protein [Actinomadura violacea]
MGLEIPAEVQWLSWIVGSDWPEGDETAMRRCADAWRQAATSINDLVTDVTGSVNDVRGTLDAEAAEKFQKNVEQWITTDPRLLPSMAEACGKLADVMDNGALDIEYAKYMFIALLIVTAIEIAMLIAAAFETFGASTAGIPAVEGAAQVTARTIFKELMEKLGEKFLGAVLKGAAFGALQGGGLDLVVQGVQIAQGNRKGVDWGKTGQATLDGAIGGAISGGIGFGAGKIPGVGDAAATPLGNMFKGMARDGASEAISGAAGTIATSAIHGDPLSWDAIAKGATSGAFGGAVGGGKGGLKEFDGGLPGGDPSPPSVDPTPVTTHTPTGGGPHVTGGGGGGGGSNDGGGSGGGSGGGGGGSHGGGGGSHDGGGGSGGGGGNRISTLLGDNGGGSNPGVTLASATPESGGGGGSPSTGGGSGGGNLGGNPAAYSGGSPTGADGGSPASPSSTPNGAAPVPAGTTPGATPGGTAPGAGGTGAGSGGAPGARPGGGVPGSTPPPSTGGAPSTGSGGPGAGSNPSGGSGRGRDETPSGGSAPTSHPGTPTPGETHTPTGDGTTPSGEHTPASGDPHTPTGEPTNPAGGATEPRPGGESTPPKSGDGTTPSSERAPAPGGEHAPRDTHTPTGSEHTPPKSGDGTTPARDHAQATGGARTPTGGERTTTPREHTHAPGSEPASTPGGTHTPTGGERTPASGGTTPNGDGTAPASGGGSTPSGDGSAASTGGGSAPADTGSLPGGDPSTSGGGETPPTSTAGKPDSQDGGRSTADLPDAMEAPDHGASDGANGQGGVVAGVPMPMGGMGSMGGGGGSMRSGGGPGAGGSRGRTPTPSPEARRPESPARSPQEAQSRSPRPSEPGDAPHENVTDGAEDGPRPTPETSPGTDDVLPSFEDTPPADAGGTEQAPQENTPAGDEGGPERPLTDDGTPAEHPIQNLDDQGVVRPDGPQEHTPSADEGGRPAPERPLTDDNAPAEHPIQDVDDQGVVRGDAPESGTSPEGDAPSPRNAEPGDAAADKPGEHEPPEGSAPHDGQGDDGTTDHDGGADDAPGDHDPAQDLADAEDGSREILSRFGDDAPSVDFSSHPIDPAAVHEINRALGRLAADYPGMMQRLNRIESTTMPGEDETLAYARPGGPDQGIYINDEAFGDNAARTAEGADEEADGFTVPGGGSTEGVFTHEFGHQLGQRLLDDPAMRAELNKAISDALGVPYDATQPHDPAMKSRIEDALSQYGATNPHELMAEAFTEHRLAENPRALARAVGDVMDRHFRGEATPSAHDGAAPAHHDGGPARHSDGQMRPDDGRPRTGEEPPRHDTGRQPANDGRQRPAEPRPDEGRPRSNDTEPRPDDARPRTNETEPGRGEAPPRHDSGELSPGERRPGGGETEPHPGERTPGEDEPQLRRSRPGEDEPAGGDSSPPSNPPPATPGDGSGGPRMPHQQAGWNPPRHTGDASIDLAPGQRVVDAGPLRPNTRYTVHETGPDGRRTPRTVAYTDGDGEVTHVTNHTSDDPAAPAVPPNDNVDVTRPEPGVTHRIDLGHVNPHVFTGEENNHGQGSAPSATRFDPPAGATPHRWPDRYDPSSEGPFSNRTGLPGNARIEVTGPDGKLHGVFWTDGDGNVTHVRTWYGDRTRGFNPELGDSIATTAQGVPRPNTHYMVEPHDRFEVAGPTRLDPSDAARSGDYTDNGVPPGTFTYHTNDHGQTDTASGRPEYDAGMKQRNGPVQTDVGHIAAGSPPSASTTHPGEYSGGSFDGGHIFPHEARGPGERINYFPQESKTNRGHTGADFTPSESWRHSFEAHLHSQSGAGHSIDRVDFFAEPNHDGITPQVVHVRWTETVPSPVPGGEPTVYTHYRSYHNLEPGLRGTPPATGGPSAHPGGSDAPQPRMRAPRPDPGDQRVAGEPPAPGAEPHTPAPSGAEPHTSEPRTDEPRTGEPHATEPGAAEPHTPAPSDAEPRTGEPPATEPHTGEPRATTPSTAEPHAAEPGTGEPHTPAPSDAEPHTDEPGAAEPRAGDPRGGEPRTDEPRTEPRATDPSTAEPHAAEPGAAEPRTPAPSGAEPHTAVEPSSTEPGPSEPRATDPSTAEPLADELGASRPDARSHYGWYESEAPSPGTAGPSSSAGAPRPRGGETTDSGAPRTENPAGAANRSPETTRPGEAEAPRGESAAPSDGGRPDTTPGTADARPEQPTGENRPGDDGPARLEGDAPRAETEPQPRSRATEPEGERPRTADPELMRRVHENEQIRQVVDQARDTVVNDRGDRLGDLLDDDLHTRLPDHPELARIIEGSGPPPLTRAEQAIHDSLLARPRTLHSLLSHPEAVHILEDSIREVNERGPGEILAEGPAKPVRTPLEDWQTLISDRVIGEIGTSRAPGQPGFDHEALNAERARAGEDRPLAKDNPLVNDYLDDLYRAAEEQRGTLHDVLRDLANEPEDAKMRPGAKDRVRALDKIINENDGDASTLNDLLGGKVQFDSVADLYRALDRVQDVTRRHGVDVVSIKDRLRSPQPSGYRDIRMTVRMPNGHIGELRLHLRSFDGVADHEHSLYEVSRDLPNVADEQAAHGEREPGLTNEERAVVEAVNRRLNEQFADALNQALPPHLRTTHEDGPPEPHHRETDDRAPSAQHPEHTPAQEATPPTAPTPPHEGQPIHAGQPTHEGQPAHGLAPTHSGQPTREGQPTRSDEPTSEGQPIHDGQSAHEGEASHDGEPGHDGEHEAAGPHDVVVPADLPSHLHEVFRGSDETPAGRSFHDPSDPAMRDLAQRVPADPHRFVVDGHGDADGLRLGGGRRLGVDDLADLIRNDPNWNGREVLLLSCHTGDGEFAARLAERLGVPVVAPHGLAWSDGDGNVYASSGHPDADGQVRPGIPPDGSWTAHHPDGTTTPAGEGGYAPGHRGGDDAHPRGDAEARGLRDWFRRRRDPEPPAGNGWNGGPPHTDPRRPAPGYGPPHTPYNPTANPGAAPGVHPGAAPAAHPGGTPYAHPGGAPGVRPGMAPGGAPSGRPGAHPGMAPDGRPAGPGVPTNGRTAAPASAHPGTVPGARPAAHPGTPAAHPGTHPSTAPGAHPGVHPGTHPGGHSPAAGHPGTHQPGEHHPGHPGGGGHQQEIGHVGPDTVRRFQTDHDGELYGETRLGHVFHQLPEHLQQAMHWYTVQSMPNPHLRPGADVGGFLNRVRLEENYAQHLMYLNGGQMPADGHALNAMWHRPDLSDYQRQIVQHVMSYESPELRLQEIWRQHQEHDRLREYLGGDPTPEAFWRRIGELDEALRQPLLEPVETVRGLHDVSFLLAPDGLPLGDRDPRLLIGMTQSEPGYMSTSLGANPTVVDNRPFGLRMRMRLPAGAHGLWMGRRSAYPDQRELVLPRNTRYRITNVVHTGFGWSQTRDGGWVQRPTFDIWADAYPPR